MAAPNAITGLQVEVARIFFELEASRGYLLAGGAALLAADLIDRPTKDLDFFASTRRSPRRGAGLTGSGPRRTPYDTTR